MANNNDKKVLKSSIEREQNDCSAECEKIKGSKNLNVPALRFPEFTEEWKSVHLEEIAEFQKQRISTALLNNNNYISTENILQDFEGLQSSSSIPVNTNVIEYQKGDILLSNIRPYLKKVWFADRKGGCSADVFVLRGDKCVQHFLYYVIASDRFINYVMSGVKGVKMPRGDKSQMDKYAFSIPTNTEQRKIAKFLSMLDERIRLQNKIIEDLKKLKSALADKLYSSTKGETYSFRQLFDVVNERNKKLTYSNVLSASQELGMIERSDINIDIKFEQDSISKYKIVRRGDYVVHLRSFQGGFAFSDRTGICSPAYTILRPNDMVVYGYLSLFFTSKPFIKSLKLVTYGIRDGRSINVEEWLDMTVTLPTRQEQSHIISIINTIDDKLNNENQIHTCLLQQRAFLLKVMFI